MVAAGDFAAAQSGGMLQISSQPQSDGRTLHCWAIPPVAMLQILPCWTVVDNHVLIASNTTLYNVALKQMTSTSRRTKSIRTTEGYKKVTAKLPGNLISFSYTDSKVQFTQLMVTAQQFWPMATMAAKRAGITLPVMLPSVADVVEDMGPSCAYSWFDADGLRSHYRGSGVELSLGAGAGAGVGAGIMMVGLRSYRFQAPPMMMQQGMRNSRSNLTRAKMAIIESALERFYIDCARYPNDSEGLEALIEPPPDVEDKWAGPYLKRSQLLDPWDEPFVYVEDATKPDGFYLVSYGADRLEGGVGDNTDIYSDQKEFPMSRPLLQPNVMKARVTTTKANLRLLHLAVNQFRMDTGRFPTEEEGLMALIEQPSDVIGWQPGGYLEIKGIPKDGWGQAFIYELYPQSGKPFVIKSLGADGEEGGVGYDADLLSTDPY